MPRNDVATQGSATSRQYPAVHISKALEKAWRGAIIPCERTLAGGERDRGEAMIRLGILGAGRIGAVHAGNAVVSQSIELVAIADALDSAARELAAKTGAAARSVDDIIADPTIDAVLIGTPTDTHAALCERAGEAGKAVFCEKPIDLDAARARVCVERMAALGVCYFVGFNRRFDPSFSALRDRVRGGEIGALEILTITSRDPSPPPVSYIERSGGLFRDMMIHDLDLACWILDETPISVYASASSLVSPEIGAAGDVDTAAVILKTASGRVCQISNSRRAVYGYDQRIEVHGATGMLLAENRRETTVLRASATGYESDPAQPFFLERYAEAYRLELEAFAACVDAGGPADPGGMDGLRALVLADCATRSARSAEVVAVPDLFTG